MERKEMKNIEFFLNNIKKGFSYFKKEDYNPELYDCGISNISKCCKLQKSQEILEYLKSKLSQKYFEIKHPLKNEIKLRAVFNMHSNLINFVFFTSSNNEEIIGIIQICDFVNYFFTSNTIYCVSYAWDGALESSFGYLCSQVRQGFVDTSDLLYQDKPYGYTLYQYRPSHYIGHIFQPFLSLRTKEIAKEPSFFIPKDCKFASDNRVYFYSMTYIYKDLTDVHNFMLHESLEEFTTLVEPKDLEFKDNFFLTLWLGLPGERRAWLEQIEGSALILKNLLPYFPRIKVYIDGMTSYDRQRQDFPENKILYNQVVRATKEALKDTLVLDTEDLDLSQKEKIKEIESLIVFKSLAGYDYRTKFCYCSMCDIAISDSGTTLIVPFEVCKKPGVFFYGGFNEGYIKWLQNAAKQHEHRRVTEEKFRVAVNKQNRLVWDYHIPPEHIYNLSAEVLEELKNIKMHRLDVPPVELYAKKYEAEKNTQIKLNNNEATQSLLKNIENQKMLLEVDNLILDKELKTLQIKQLQVGYTKLVVRDDLPSAKARIHNHLAYKLGQIIIRNSKTLFDYIKLPYLLMAMSLIHKEQEKTYKEKIKTNPNLALPPLESYKDYKEALKEKECFTYKLGSAFIKAYKSWYKGGMIKFYFEAKKLEREFKNKKNDKES